ncbi:MAG: NADPH-dependent F420 reductase [Bacteroidota bacterium]|jgi:predicted dinucleotide-binding enzyme|nr:NAD(P)-binding domain-containing protein [Ignavibacteria bacterium]MCU7501189.1 NAD(P)-binding domain-containing protein [Ignavibacteria bacterium]MCU7513405.1 NAD(P)-binding domain-containing protein [Ignavibacteria bacterium]MCU7522176.1 NAD(P)-binding domain-containing protein [Ignavibacteria bacterium]MCU7525107.1 NAD(P)-binding domain-containing protein [Ignavibacteria bacterium]
MNIGILGSGNVGQQLGLGFLSQGHSVMLGTRDTSKLKDWVVSAGENAYAGGFDDAARFGELIVIATKWTGTENAINMAGKENFTNKIIVDVTNPLQSVPGSAAPGISVSPGNSAGEQIQAWLPEASVVKAFNTVSARTMCHPNLREGSPELFICGNDIEAKQAVAHFAEGWGWENITDMGDISEAFYLEALAALWVHFAFMNNSFTHAFKLLKR